MKELSEIPANDIPEGCDYALVTTEEELEQLCKDMLAAEKLAVDTETEGLLFSDIIVGICISVGPMHGRYIPIRHEMIEGHRFPDQLDPKYVFEKIGPILEQKPCVGHNVKFDMKAFWKDGVDVNWVQDTLIDANLLGTYQQGKKSLEDLVLQHFQYQMLKLKELFPKPKGRRKVEIAPAKLAPNDIERYGCEDGDYSYRLSDLLEPMCQKYVAPNIRELEMRLLRVVAEMEMHGVPASMSFLKTRSAEIGKLIERLEVEIIGEIRDRVGDPEMEINLNSPKQLGEIIYGHLGIPCANYTPSGAPSTAGAVLEDLAKKHPLMERILTYRAMIKLKGFILDKMQLRIEDDRRVRGSFNQVGTQSGRFSSSDPNLQQIPKDQIFFLWPADDTELVYTEFGDKIQDTEDGKLEGYDDDAGVWKKSIYFGQASDGKHYGIHHNEIYEAWKCITRNFIQADKDHYLIEADYSQVELRILAGESQEQTFLNAFRDGDDVHKRTAAAIYSIPFEQVIKAQRSVGKTINFGLLYGMGPQKLGASLLISTQEAKDIMSKYFENLPGIKMWINNTKTQARQDMFSRTRFGRIRRFPEIRSMDPGTRAREEREAVNHCIQGAAADVMKLALCRLSRDMRKHFGDKVRIILTVHDSVMLECEKEIPAEDVAAVLVKAMQFRPIPNWPMLEIDIGVGDSWGECKDFDVDDEHPIPAEYSGEELPKLRVRQVGREREGDFRTENLFTAIEIPEPEPEEVETVEEIHEITGSGLENEDAGEYTWILEVRDWPTKPRLEKLMKFLKEKQSDEGKHSLKLCFTDGDGYTEEVQLSGKLTLSLEDEMSFRMMLGSCTLRQDISDFDPSEIVRRMSMGEHSASNAG